MDFRHLQTFKVIVDEGSFASEAEHLQYAQSTVTLQVQQLEAELGVELFNRQKKKIQLTSAGRNLLTHAIHVLNQMEALRQSMTELVGGETGHIRLGIIEPLASLRLPKVLLEFCETHPKMRLTVEVIGTNNINQKLEEGELELGLTTPPRSSAGLLFEPFFVEPMRLLLPLYHPLCRLEKIGLSDLAAHRLVLTQPSCAYRDLIERKLLEQGLRPSVGIEIGSIETLKSAVRGGLGVAIVPKMVVEPLPEGTVVRQIDNLELQIPIGLVNKPDLATSPAIQHLVKLLRREFSQATS